MFSTVFMMLMVLPLAAVMGGSSAPSGSFGMRVFRIQRPTWQWRIANTLTPAFLKGWIGWFIIRPAAHFFGVTTMMGQLRLILIKANGERVDHGVVSRHVITTAFVDFVVDQLQTETSVFGDFKYHDSGIGTTAAAIGDTDIETTDAESRATGTQAEGASSNIYQSVGTIAYTTTKAITEHGLFNASTGVTLIDRHVFTAVNVVNGDSIQFTYEYTLSSGG